MAKSMIPCVPQVPNSCSMCDLEITESLTQRGATTNYEMVTFVFSLWITFRDPRMIIFKDRNFCLFFKGQLSDKYSFKMSQYL